MEDSGSKWNSQSSSVSNRSGEAARPESSPLTSNQADDVNAPGCKNDMDSAENKCSQDPNQMPRGTNYGNEGNYGLPWQNRMQYGGNPFNNPVGYGTTPMMNGQMNFGGGGMMNNPGPNINPIGYMPGMFNPQMMGMSLPGIPPDLFSYHLAQQQQLMQAQQQQIMMYQQAAMQSAAFQTAQSTESKKIAKQDKEKKEKKAKAKNVLKGQRKSKRAVTYCNSSSLSSASEDSDDADLDQAKRKKRRSTMSLLLPQQAVDFQNPNILMASEDDVQEQEEMVPPTDQDTTMLEQADFREKARVYQRENKHIWQQLAEEEQIKDTVTQMNVVTFVDKFVVDRGSESYVVGNKRKRKAPANFDARVDLSEDEESSNYSSVSDGGLSDYSKDALRNRLVALRASKSKHATKNSNGNDTNMDVETKELEKPKVEKVKSGQQILEEKMDSMEEYKIPAFMARKLKEEKVELFVRTWRLFGKEYIQALFRKTLKIERLGGILVKNRLRRRTPGGVFLYLMRNDNRLKKDAREEVFRPLEELKEASRKQDKTLQKQNLFAGIGKRMNNANPDATENEKPPLEEEKVDFEEESYVVPQETTPIPTVSVPLTNFPPGSLEMDLAATPFPAGMELTSYEEVCDGGYWNVDLTQYGF